VAASAAEPQDVGLAILGDGSLGEWLVATLFLDDVLTEEFHYTAYSTMCARASFLYLPLNYLTIPIFLLNAPHATITSPPRAAIMKVVC
jgi:hypothetical protein